MEVVGGTETKRRGRPPGKGKSATSVTEDKRGMLLPGHEKVVNKKIERQALKVYELQSQRIEIGKAEVEERLKLTKLMKAEGLTFYDLTDDGLVCEIDTEPKAKVHKAKRNTDETGDEE